MIRVNTIDKQGKEYSQQYSTQAAADIALRIALENGCEAKIMGNKK